MKSFIRPSLLCLALAGACFAQSATAEIPVRRNALSLEADADLAALNTALAQMRAMSCDNPASWYYQGAIHSVPNQVKNNQLCPSYQSIKTDLKPAWATCTHVKGSELHFLIWHRLYILHFEQIVRELSGKADFALPYWFYTDDTQRTMPPPFRDPALALYAKERVSTMNAGGIIPSYMDQFLDVGTLNQNKVFAVFSRQIDRAPHGAMHSYLGGSFDNQTMYNPIYQADLNGLMAQVPSAGFDPIFWLHHSNIDLLWQKWESGPNGSRPSVAELEAVPWTYKFFDAQGNTIEYTVAQAYKKAFEINYVYDQMLLGTPRHDSVQHRSLVERAQPQEKRLVWTRTGLSAPLAERSVTLDALQPTRNTAPLMELEDHGALVLELEVSFTEEPQASYMVYVVQDGKKRAAGPMTFFGASHHGADAGMEGHDHDMSLTFAFDLSDEIEPGEDYDVLIERQTGDGSAARVTSMSLYRY